MKLLPSNGTADRRAEPYLAVTMATEYHLRLKVWRRRTNSCLTALPGSMTVTVMTGPPSEWPHFDGLTPVGDVSHADWLRDRLHPSNRQSVGTLVPTGFESYARVLPPVWATSNGVTTHLRWRDIASSRGVDLRPTTTFNQLVGWDLYGPDGNEPPAPYHAPVHGDMDPDDLSTLSEILATATTTPDNCWFLFWEGYGWRCLPAPGEGQPRWHAPHRDYLLFNGAVTAATGFRYDPRTQAPTIWWPQDHAWCVATDIDGYRTYLAADGKTVDALLADERLEIMPVSIDQTADPSPYLP
jgi:hypothetical protein